MKLFKKTALTSDTEITIPNTKRPDFLTVGPSPSGIGAGKEIKLSYFLQFSTS